MDEIKSVCLKCGHVHDGKSPQCPECQCQFNKRVQ